MSSSTDISERIVEAVLAKKLAPGARLGEQQLCDLFDAPRAVVREALTALSVRGMVKASARRGWYLVELSQEEAQAAFDARLVIETGLIRCSKPPASKALQRLRTHLKRQREAVEGTDVGARSFLLGDFHVCLAECLGNNVLAATVRDLTARTMLIALRYQSEDEAVHSFSEHSAIVEALGAGDMALAEQRVFAHLSTWQLKLRVPADQTPDPLAELRLALTPLSAPR
ncbi:GntR family transcriptional regulator [Variovorax sp. ZT5P49]|uniref:GntR family transcriptional regulator n=1 Tax=Variovorax sp. ZT5P49 TaxID=3443733 RepID=UPI003F46FA9F